MKGLANWVQVVTRVFEYLAMLKSEGPRKWIYDEIEKVAEIDFAYLDEEEESDFVERLCVEMDPYHGRDRRDLLTASVRYDSLNCLSLSVVSSFFSLGAAYYFPVADSFNRDGFIHPKLFVQLLIDASRNMSDSYPPQL